MCSRKLFVLAVLTSVASAFAACDEANPVDADAVSQDTSIGTEVDMGMTPDSMAPDTMAPDTHVPDMVADTSVPDVAPIDVEPPTFVSLTVFVDDVGGSPIADISICALDDPSVTCATTDAAGEAAVVVESGVDLVLTLEGDGWAPHLVPVRTPAEQAVIGPLAIISTGDYDALFGDADPASGHAIVFVPNDTSLDPFTVADITMASPEGEVFYFGPDGPVATPPTLPGEGTAMLAQGLSDGWHALELAHPQSTCVLERGIGWPVAGASAPPLSIDTPVRSGTLTVLAISCADHARDVRTCDFVEGTCQDPNAPKCRPSFFTDSVDGRVGYGTVCDQELAQKGLGEACARPTNQGGVDDCGAGLYCANWGESDQQSRVCQNNCASPSDCDPGQVCHGFGSRSGDYALGVCLDACDPFAPQCAPNNACKGAPQTDGTLAFRCLWDGQAAEDESCANDPCAGSLQCWGVTMQCKELCSDDNPCTDPSKSCMMLQDPGAENIGLCI